MAGEVGGRLHWMHFKAENVFAGRGGESTEGQGIPPSQRRNAIRIHLRAPNGQRIEPRDTSALDWPPSRYHPARGWPTHVPQTSQQGYLSGYHALNLPTLPGEPRLGDWQESATWWGPTYLGADGVPDTATLWGPAGDLEGVPGTPELLDARTALALIEHPAANHANPVWCATIAQAILDLAWGELAAGGPGPGPHELTNWTDGDTENHTCQLAIDREQNIRDAATLERWRAWQQHALGGDEPLVWPPLPSLPQQSRTAIRTRLKTHPGRRPC